MDRNRHSDPKQLSHLHVLHPIAVVGGAHRTVAEDTPAEHRDKNTPAAVDTDMPLEHLEEGEAEQEERSHWLEEELSSPEVGAIPREAEEEATRMA